MTKALTSASVQRLRSSDEGIREIPDGGCTGLYLLIYPSGKKSWALRYRRPSDNRPAKLTLGSVFNSSAGREPDIKEPEIGDHLSLGAAHLLVAKLRNEINQGRDPGLAHMAAKRAVLSSDKFSGAAVDFIEQHAKRKTRKWKSTARLLGLQPAEHGLVTIKAGLADRWREKPLAEIDGDLIHAVVDEVRERGVPGLERRRTGPSESQARVMHAALSKMFSWLVAKRRLRQNPIVGLTKPEPSRTRDRVLTDDEIKKFWKATGEVGEPFGQLLKLLLLTGCRINEVAGMRRSELSDHGATWTIPGERTKKRKTHTVPLPSMARDILATVDTDGEFVFTTNGLTPVSGWSKMKRRLDEATGIPPWVLHDLRRTMRSGLGKLGIAPHVAELAIGHAQGGVKGIYDRYTYTEEIKTALDRWAAHVLGVVEGRPANVSPLRRRP